MAEAADALLRRLEWTVLRRLDGLLQGDYRTLLRGAGVDLADLREYQHHDDVRHIDWNVTARLQTPYVRQFVEDRDLTAWFLLDLSGSMGFGSGTTSKIDIGRGFVGALARVVTRHGNRVGAVLYGRGVDRVLPPRATRMHVLSLLQHMQLAAQPSDGDGGDGRQAAKTAATQAALPLGTQLGALLQAAAGLIKRRSLVFVVSDFISTPGWHAALARLALRHEVVAVRLFDPAEHDLPDLGLVTVQDAETGEQLFIDTSDPGFRQRHAALAQAQETALREAFVRSGADTLELSTDDDLLEALLRFADLRRGRARQAAPRRLPAHLKAHALPAGAPP